MLKSLSIKNFRCFAELRFQSLDRINLIAGKNNTGKTSLLEAIYLQSFPFKCDEALTINKWRGVAEPMHAPEEVISWLFHDRRPEPGLELSITDEKGAQRLLSIWLLDPPTLRQRFPEAEDLLQNSFPERAWGGDQLRLVMCFQVLGTPPRYAVAVWGGGGLSWTGFRPSVYLPTVMLSSGPKASDQDTQHFSVLASEKRLDELIAPLQIIEPRLQSLTQLPLAGELTIHGDIGLSRLVPVPFMGEGMRRILSLVLAIANVPGGIVLVDEIENGLHHSVQKRVWTAVAEAARQVDAQIFATTHSYECIRAAHEAFNQDSRYDFRLHRLDRLDERIRVATYDQETLETGLELAHEVR